MRVVCNLVEASSFGLRPLSTRSDASSRVRAFLTLHPFDGRGGACRFLSGASANPRSRSVHARRCHLRRHDVSDRGGSSSWGRQSKLFKLPVARRGESRVVCNAYVVQIPSGACTKTKIRTHIETEPGPELDLDIEEITFGVNFIIDVQRASAFNSANRRRSVSISLACAGSFARLRISMGSRFKSNNSSYLKSGQ